MYKNVSGYLRKPSTFPRRKANQSWNMGLLMTLREIFQIAGTPLVTLIIAFVGWIITTRYNDTQLKIAKDKNTADVEIAKVNSAVQFLQYFEKIPESEPEKRSNAVAISIPILPPELAFDLAVSQIEHDTGAMQALFLRYQQKSFSYLERHLGQGPIFHTAEFVPDIEYSEKPLRLFKFLHSRKLDYGLEDYLFFSDVHNATTRTNAIINYFRFLRSSSDQSRNEALAFIKHSNLVNQLLDKPGVQPAVRHAVALAACMAFLNGYGDARDNPILERAATYFWNDLDIAGGEIPREDSLEGFVYRHAFYYTNPAGPKIIPLPPREMLSRELHDKLKQIKHFNELPWENVRLIMYSYMAYTPRDTDSPFVAFLAPKDTVDVYKMILDWANNPDKRREIGRELNSLTGSAIFHNLKRSPNSQRAWAELTIRFYESDYSDDWYPAKIIEDIVSKFPDLSVRVKQRHWGIPLR